MADFETDLAQWREGERRVELQARDPERQPVLDRVVAAVERELRRRLGGAYTTEELAELYERGTDWCTDVAARVAPEDPWAW
ncbi:MAG: hypothetical protein H0U79_03870, partial [Solirubrobacterales bacterium]|nr:hypothetical protein [Solirubrobacterales bacterium]